MDARNIILLDEDLNDIKFEDLRAFNTQGNCKMPKFEDYFKAVEAVIDNSNMSMHACCQAPSATVEKSGVFICNSSQFLV
eukprot:7027266-Ditylum_brightwellii.AAC.1